MNKDYDMVITDLKMNALFEEVDQLKKQLEWLFEEVERLKEQITSANTNTRKVSN